MTRTMEISEVRNAVQELLGEQFIVEEQDVTKENGRTLKGLCIRENASPNFGAIFYPECMNENSVDEMAQAIVESYRLNGKCEVSETITDMFSYGCAKETLFLRLFDVEFNGAFMKTSPCTVVMDRLIAVPYVMIRNEGNEMIYARVTNQMAEDWKVTSEKIFEDGLKNMTLHSGIVFETLSEALGLPEISMEDPFYVLTNSKRNFGSAIVLNGAVLTDIYDYLCGGFYLLPSSTHEWIVAKGGTVSVDKALEMVRSVNEDVLSAEDFLSNHVWYYDGEKVICF